MRSIANNLIGSVVVLIAAPAAAQQLEEFERIVAKCKTSYAAPFSEVTLLAATGKWVKRTTWPVEVQYDVKKTDSLVSPFTAYIAIIALVAGNRAESEDAAKVLEITQDGVLSQRETRIAFAYRSGAWQPLEATERTAMRLKPNEQYQAPVTIRISKDELLRPYSATERCLQTK
jgi:hypothetical protein